MPLHFIVHAAVTPCCNQVCTNHQGARSGVALPFVGAKPSCHGRKKGFEGLYGFLHP